MQDQQGSNQQQAMNQTTSEVRYNSFVKLVLMTINICMAPFYFGYNIAYFGTFEFKNLKQIFGITLDENLANGLLQGCIPIGAGIGAISSFFLLKYFSRRNSLLVVGCIAMVCGILLLIPNQILLFLGRFVQGICVGLYSALAPLIIKQFAPTQISGTMGAFNQNFIAVGVFFACFLQYILLKFSQETDHWRIMFGFTLLTTLLQMVLLLVIYRFQTPKYLLQMGEQQKCRKVLQYIYKPQYVNEVMSEKKRDLGISDNKSEKTKVSGSVITQNPSEIDQSQETLLNKEGVKFNKIRLVISIHLALLQQFVGINVVVGYGTDIAGNIFPQFKNLIPVFLNFEQVLTSLTCGYILAKVGRKPILQVGTIVGVASLVLIAVGFMFQKSHKDVANIIVIIGLIIFMANFGMSLGPIVWLYIPEILQPKYISISTLANWSAAAIIMFLYPVLASTFGTSVPLFLFFAAWCAVSFFIGQKYLVETKGKQEKDIYLEFDQISGSSKRSPLDERDDE